MLSATLPELDGWGSISHEGAERVLALANVPSGVFRPNIVLTSTPSTAPIEAASSVSIAAILTDHPGAQIIAVDLWTEQVVDGRMITASYPSGDEQIVIQRWIWATGLRHVHLTASAATHQFLACAPMQSSVATALVLSGEMSATQVDVDAAPKLDVAATAAVGDRSNFWSGCPLFSRIRLRRWRSPRQRRARCSARARPAPSPGARPSARSCVIAACSRAVVAG